MSMIALIITIVIRKLLLLGGANAKNALVVCALGVLGSDEAFLCEAYAVATAAAAAAAAAVAAVQILPAPWHMQSPSVGACSPATPTNS